MADQNLQARKRAAAAGATDNSGIGIDGDGPSVADIRENGRSDFTAKTPAATSKSDHSASSDEPAEEPDPVTGTTSNATGAEQAAENQRRDPVS